MARPDPSIVILTGAGISAESGIATFRESGGLWESHSLEEVATPQGFARDPDLVHAFYNARRAAVRGVSPNPAHRALARLEQALPGQVLIVTQNVDDLHERAGSKRVIHMHGELSRALCHACQARWAAPDLMHAGDPCPRCGKPATRPDIVWFGEFPYYMDEIETALSACTTFAAIGTSGQVWPAAGFVQRARATGARCIEINLDQSEVSGDFHEHLIGRAGEAVPAWAERVLAG